MIGGIDERDKYTRYNSKLKYYVFWLWEKASHAIGQNSLAPQGKHNLNFWLAHDQALIWHQTNNFFTFCFLVFSWHAIDITKHWMTGPVRDSDFEGTVSVKQNLLFTLGSVINISIHVPTGRRVARGTTASPTTEILWFFGQNVHNMCNLTLERKHYRIMLLAWFLKLINKASSYFLF